MGKLSRTPQELLMAISRELKVVEAQLKERVIGATIDWQYLDAIPYHNGFFNTASDSIIEITLPVKLITEKGLRKLDITEYMSAFALLEGQQFYITNPYCSRESPKRYMFVQDDFRHDVLSYVRDNFDFDHCFYAVAQGTQQKINQVTLQESFDLNLHYLVSSKFTGAFPLIGATSKGLESLFMIYWGYWLHTKLMLMIIQNDLPAYKRSESSLLAPNERGTAPYTQFKIQMDNLYRSSFNELQNGHGKPPRRYMLSYKLQGIDHYVFLSPYVSVAVNVDILRCRVIHDVKVLPKEQAITRVQMLEIPVLSQLLLDYYSSVHGT